MMRILRLAALSGLLSARILQGDIGGVPHMTPEQQAIHDAASIKDPGERERALEKAISAGLLAPEHLTRYQVLQYLEDNRRWIDLRSFASTLIQFSKIDQNGGAGLWILDDAELMRATRYQRENFYRRAIMDGEIILPHGRRLTRKGAMLLACDDGFDSLAPLIREYATVEYPDEHVELLTTLELGAGAEDREDAIRLSAKRLQEMETAVLYKRLGSDDSFRKVVTRVAVDGCTSNPFLGGKNPGCADMRAAVSRLAAHEAELKTRAPAVTSPEARDPDAGFKKTWLDQLKGAVR